MTRLLDELRQLGWAHDDVNGRWLCAVRGLPVADVEAHLEVSADGRRWLASKPTITTA